MGMSQPFLPQIGVSYMPMVMTSNWPPLVAMSVVTRWRSTPSSSVTHLSLMSGFADSKCLDSFCIVIMWPLFTVAITSSVAAFAPVAAATPMRAASRALIFIGCLLGGMERVGQGRVATSRSVATGAPLLDMRQGPFDTLLLAQSRKNTELRRKSTCRGNLVLLQRGKGQATAVAGARRQSVPMKVIRLRDGKERSLLRRHPWVFQGSVDKGKADAGETVRVESDSGQFLCW